MHAKYKNTFSGTYFMGFRDNSEYEKAKIAILPASYEGTCSLGLGTKNAPEAILEASHFIEPYDEEADFSLDNVGMHTLKLQSFTEKQSPKKVIESVKDITSQIIADNKFPVMIGGEHSLTIGTVQAIAEKTKNLSVLQLDAHTDLDSRYEGEMYHHATMARTIKETTDVSITQVGVRSCIRDHLEYAKKKNIDIFFAHNIINKKHKINDIVKKLDENVYITLDVDVFDPAIFPNTGTPEPNGLKWQYIVNLIAEVAKKKNIVGIDLVEHASLNPDESHYSDYSAVKIVHKMLCLIFKNKKN